jgi:hypothetical protein
MRNRIIKALNNEQILNFINNPYLFGIFLKGGFEDLFSKQLYNIGFNDNADLKSQHKIVGRNSIDIAQLVNYQIVSLIEFGHQFSLQCNADSALEKIKEDALKRTQPVTLNADMFTVQIITDVISLNINEPWVEYFTNRYGINNSIQHRQMAEARIIEIKNTVDQFNAQYNIGEGEIVSLEINNNAGHIRLNFLINGPYNYDFRSNLPPVIKKPPKNKPFN